MTTKQYAKRYTDEEREAYRQAQRERAREQLDAALDEMQSDEGFRAWVSARGRFHHYSFNNQLLILQQHSEATKVAPVPVWRKLGRYPRKGEHALYVFVPWQWHKATDAEPGEIDSYGQRAFVCHKHGRVCVKATTFKLGPVFDVSQTDGEPLPEPPECAPLDGDSHAGLEPKLIALAGEIGFTVSTEKLEDETGGYCDHGAKRIVLAEGHAPNARVRVLVHEIAHALGISYREYGREQAECIVESVTYIVLAGQGFETDVASVPYVAGWGNGEAREHIRKFAETIDEIARRIEGALT